MANTILNIYDYTVMDPYWGFEEQFVIGYGDLSAESINRQIDAATGDLDVHINSQGGKVFDGWAIYNKLKSYQGGFVTVYIDGIAASIASIIAMAGEKVIMMQASMMMIHKPTGFYMGAMDAGELASEAASLTEIEAVLIDIYASKTGLNNTKLQKLLDATTWLSPDSALALGFCDEVVKTVNKATIPQNTFDRLFTNATEGARIYANSAFSIKQNNDMSTVNDIAEKQEKQANMLTEIWNFIKGEPKNEEVVAEVVVAEPVAEVVSTEPTVEELKAEVAALKAEKENAQAILNKANEMYNKMETTLSEIKSNYAPAAKGTDFVKTVVENNSDAKFVKPTKK